MGKGIASDLKKYYPEMFKEYKNCCDTNNLNIGDLYLYKTSNNWRSPSKLEYIEKGLQKLIKDSTKLQINNIAMPKLGCGNGGLDWESEVKPIL